MAKRLTTEEFVLKAKQKHGELYDYSLTNYTLQKEKVNINCFIHGVFQQNANSHLMGNGCLKCANESIGQKVRNLAKKRRSEIRYSEDGKSMEIPLTKGKFAIIDADVYHLVEKYNWCFMNQGYAVTHAKGNEMMLMHSLLSKEFHNGKMIDHINRNRLDNRMCNLRPITFQQNMFNKSVSRNSTSKYKGVYFNKRLNKWQAQIETNGEKFNLKLHTKEEDAAYAYNNKALELFGEFACLNEI